jgi:hypothetical protein
MADEPKLDATSDPGSSHDPQQGAAERAPRPFLGIRFQCCKTYGRIYRNDAQTAYKGQCPKCRAKLSVPIGSGGTSSRFFNAN